VRVALVALVLALVLAVTPAGVARAQEPVDSTSVLPDTLSVPPSFESAPPPEPPQAGGIVQTGNVLNPNVSVIGWIQASAGNDESWEDPPVLVKEAELGLQAVVDPYSRADFFISFHDIEAPALEEGYLTLLALPAGLQVRLGKFRNQFGKFNVTHEGETPFADRPLAAVAFLGGEGLSSAGGELSWLVPLPVFVQLTGEVERPPDESPTFAAGRKRGDLLYVGRANMYADLSEAWNLTLGGSIASGPRFISDDLRQEDLREVLSHTLRATASGVDLTLRWKNRRRAIYRSLVWQTEGYRVVKDLIPALCFPGSNVCSVIGNQPDARYGGFSYIDYQFARRWHAGVRGDAVGPVKVHGTTIEKSTLGGLVFLTFTPTEFSLVSAQVRRVGYATYGNVDAPRTTRTEGFLKVTFNIGPHGAHPF
jgi:hypothetical protein